MEDGEVKITKCLEECEKQWRPVQGKSGWEKQKEEEAKEEVEKKKRGEREEKETEKRKNSGSQENSRGMGSMG